MGFLNNVKNAALKKMMTSQMKKQGADDAQIALITEMLDSDPELFEKIAKETEKRVKAGESQMDAAQAVMLEHQAQLQQIMMKNPAMLQKMKIEAMKHAAKNRK